MGIHYFYTWLTCRYPLIKKEFNTKTVPQIDYLYLDLNGIIHRCAKDDSALFKDLLCGKRTEEIYISILNYTNYVISLIKPKRGIMIAIDGVAPRAKMNNQRNRRFMASKSQRQVNDFMINTLKISPNIVYFKNNSISPGTEFMIELNKTIYFFIQRKIHEDLDWKGLEVVFSGGDVPGEGEHKILNYIRQNRHKPDFDNSHTHCIYGNDSDLVLLSLITHLPHVMLLREEFQPAKRTVINSATKRTVEPQKMEVIYINLLREYFQVEFDVVVKENPAQIENIIDDFVLFSFFIGNDFLHQVYCMNTKLGVFDEFIEIMLEFYKTKKRFLTNKSEVDWMSFYLVLKEFLPLQKKMIKTTLADFNSRLSELHKNTFYAKLKVNKNNKEVNETEVDKKESFFAQNRYQILVKPETQDVVKVKAKIEVVTAVVKLDKSADLISGLMSTLKIKPSDVEIIEKNIAVHIVSPDDPLIINPDLTLTETNPIDNLINELHLKPSDPLLINNQGTDSEIEDPPEDIPHHGPLTIKELNEEELGEPEEEGASENEVINQEINEEESKRYLEEFRSQYHKLVTARDLMKKIHDQINANENHQEVYYKEYFGINDNFPVEISKICHNYLNGVDFVYKYYYSGCPSWSWYYKYHLSPLLFDIHDYLKRMFDNGQQIEFKYEPSIPTDPYIQLLYILPNESLNLLPQALREKALHVDSKISHYYPIVFEIAPFDKHRDYTWLALIEHIDDRCMDQFIKQLDFKTLLNAEELFRNRRGDNYFFKADSACQVTIESPVSGFDSVYANISITKIEIDSEFTTMAGCIDYNANHVDKNEPRIFPTLFFSNKIDFKKTVRNGRYKYELILTFEAIEELYNRYQYLNQTIPFANSKIPKNIYCDPIFQQQFIVRRVEIANTGDPDGFFRKIAADTIEYLESVGIKVPASELMYFQKRYSKAPVFYVETPTFSTLEFSGISLQKANIKTESENPTALLFFAGILDSSYLKLKEFPVGKIKDWFQPGQICFNVQTGDIIRLEEVNTKKDIPQIIKHIVLSKNLLVRNIELHPVPEKLHLVDEKLIRDLDLSLEHLKILWIVLDSIKILCDHASHTTLVLGDGFEVGLNFINFLNRRTEDWKMVSDMVKMQYKFKHEERKGPIRKNSFTQNECMFIWVGEGGRLTKYYNMYLTSKGLVAVKEFFKENKLLIDYLKIQAKNLLFFDKKARVLRYKTQFNAYHIFGDIPSEEINILLFKIYSQVLKKKHSNLMLLPSLHTNYSMDVVNDQLVNFKLPQPRENNQPINPVYLLKYCAREDVVWPPFGTRPYYHEEGDRVAFINSQHPAIKFGMLATVIGVYKDLIEILFDEPFIGATNLNGRCPNFRGKIVCVFDLFNLSKWNNIVVDFEEPPKIKKSLWKGDFDLDGLLKLISDKQRQIWKAHF